MNWRRHLQVRDLDPGERFEVACQSCKQTYMATVGALTRDIEDAGYLYLDEVEDKACCRDRRCRGNVRISRVRAGDASAFIGGLA